jgi:thioredoxin reductase (NADPH)
VNGVAVVGCGPAGIAAAVQLGREGRRPLVFESRHPGGLLRNANLVENYPGFPGGISGPALVERMSTQLDRSGIELRREEIVELRPRPGGFLLRGTTAEYPAARVVLAPGTRPRRLTVPAACRSRVFSELVELADRGSVEGRRIAVIGAGDAAFDYALNLARANEVVILNRAATARCLPLLEHRAAGQQTIDHRRNLVVDAVESVAEGLLLHCRSAAREYTLCVDYLLAAIGREPRLELLRDLTTPPPGLWLVGDAAHPRHRQTALAVGDGLRAALELTGDLEGAR